MKFLATAPRLARTSLQPMYKYYVEEGLGWTEESIETEGAEGIIVIKGRWFVY